jgi:hypothetical protein
MYKGGALRVFGTTGGLVMYEKANGQKQYYMGGGSGKEILVRMSCPDGQQQFYVHKGEEIRLQRIELPDGRKVFYEGIRGEEHVVGIHLATDEKIKLSDGTFQFYMCDNGDERLVRAKFPDGQTAHYQGRRCEERLVSVELANGHTMHYKGRRCEEHLVMVELPNGKKFFYEGKKGCEEQIQCPR